MKNTGIYFLVLVFLVFISCAERVSAPDPIERVQYHMGTYGRVLIYGGSNADVDAAFAKIKELDDLLSDYNPSSQVSEINKYAGIKPINVDPQVTEVLGISIDVADQTGGEFDPTIGALTIGVYGFGRDGIKQITDQEISNAKSLVNYRDLILHDNTAYLSKKGMMIDLGGIGKGYAVENAVGLLKERGVASGVVSLSGDIKVFGHQAEIAIRNPDSEQPIATFTTGSKDLAISTSGSYERSVNIDGEVYHHLIVPDTGKPGHDFLSLTVVMEESSTLADAYATALYVMGREKALEFIGAHDEIGVFIIFADNEIFYNKGFDNLVSDLKRYESY